ncbi:hypothetical protein PRIPAC_77074, partial [Pristionchus pacificus]|uniref:G protein-coupled receptor n=1 Tax=Pristionchus pacificus TaxID=54126 RepID=A0A2A6CLA1_PRIPA
MEGIVLNRSSRGENDAFIGTITEWINQISLLFSAISIPSVILIFVLLLKERAYSRSSFYLIYKVGLAYDIIALVTTLIFRTIPSFGWFALLFTISPYPAQICLFFNYFTRVGQGLTNLFICLNRASAILLPLRHENVRTLLETATQRSEWKNRFRYVPIQIWTSRLLLPSCFAIQLTSTVAIGSVAASFGVHWLHYPQGQLYAMPNHSSALYAFWRAIFIPVVIILLSITALYMGILCQFWRQLSSFHKMNKKWLDSTESKQAFALFHLALCNVVIEILYCVAYFFSFVYKVNYQRDYRIFFAGNIVLSNCYSTAPCVMLIIFCGSVRRHAWRFVPGYRQEIP